MIQVNNVSFDYPGKRALDNISFTLETNTLTALVGSNGAGKSTLLRCLAALEPVSAGEILITIDEQHYTTEQHPRQLHQISSYLSDFFGLYDALSVEQCLTYVAWSKGCTQVADQVQLAAQRLDLLPYLNNKTETLSRGVRQRVAIAQSIIQEPKMLYLDEPAAGLDPEARASLSDLLKELQQSGMTILVSSHILSELELYCSHMLVLNEGKILDHCEIKNSKHSMSEHYLSLVRRAKK